jgi:hypothetical protein
MAKLEKLGKGVSLEVLLEKVNELIDKINNLKAS